MNKKKGFTLVELLVVIAIIALLMSILMPALSRVRKAAQGVACMANLRQWTAVAQMFCDDHDGFFWKGYINPGYTYGLLNPGHDERFRIHEWMAALKPYYSDAELLFCPLATQPIATENVFEAGLPWTDAISDKKYRAWGILGRAAGSIGGVGKPMWPGCPEAAGSYGPNTKLWNSPPGANPGDDTTLYWRTPNVKGGNNIPLFFDDLFWGGSLYYDPEGLVVTEPQQICPYDDYPRTFIFNRHDGFTNYAFVDFSVRAVGLKEPWKLRWSRKFDINNTWTIAGGVTETDWEDQAPWMLPFKDY